MVGKTAALFVPLLVSSSVVGFMVPTQQQPQRSGQLAMADGIAGSFFNPVPPPSDDNNNDDQNNPNNKDDQNNPNNKDEEINEIFDFDSSVAELMKARTKKSRASSPSTIGGVPSAKATGFGKKKTTDAKPRVIKTTASSSSSSFVGIGKPMNDINNPQYDDQGYTLYADEETGEKKRVFEALVEYPCQFTMKIVGLNEGAFAAEIVAVVAESCDVSSSDVKFTERRKGKYTSVTVNAPVQSAEMLYSLYENIDRDPRVKFKF